MKIKSSITIKRPNGETEVVDTSVKFGWISEELFAAAKKATKAAGKGDMLSYKNERIGFDVLSAADAELKAYYDSCTKIERA
jgi:hypothetical protein